LCAATCGARLFVRKTIVRTGTPVAPSTAFPEESPVQYTLEPNRLLSRREFSRESVLAMLAGVVITITGCGDDDDSNPTGPSDVGVIGTVSANHGHVATVTGAQITAGGAVNLDIRGQADHTHTVALTAAQVVQIGNRQQVVVTSTTTTDHLHTVTFN
jgi:hypothetical protein